MPDPPQPSRDDSSPGLLSNLSLELRFAMIGSAVSVLGMLFIGNWVSTKIEESVVRNSAISAAVYMDSLIAPLSQELAEQTELSDASLARLRNLLTQEPVTERIVSVKLWKSEGYIAFATAAEFIGRKFEPSEALRSAWQGHLVAEFDSLDREEAAREQEAALPLLEVYNPIHSIISGEIIAVVEFYQNAKELDQDLTLAQRTSWAIVAGVFVLTFLALFETVRSAGRTIDRQHRQLVERITEITRVSEQNTELRARVQAASQRSTTLNERFLKRIGAELHDGPAQALALAGLRIGALRKAGNSAQADTEVELIHSALDEALSNIRSLSRGLILPDLDGLPIDEIIRKAAEAHGSRTGTEVAVTGPVTGCTLGDIPPAYAICIYRFVQEGLMNAYRHAGGIGQSVTWQLDKGALVVCVSDDGPGFDVGNLTKSDRLGLRALRERVQSVGGTFEIASGPGEGTHVMMRLITEKSQ